MRNCTFKMTTIHPMLSLDAVSGKEPNAFTQIAMMLVYDAI